MSPVDPDPDDARELSRAARQESAFRRRKIALIHKMHGYGVTGLLTARQAALLAYVSPVTIRQWQHRGKLHPTACDVATGRLLYRPDEVLTVERATRRAGGSRRLLLETVTAEV